MRVDSEAHADALRQVFGSHVVIDPAAPPNFSVRFSEDRNHTHVLYRGECAVLRTFDAERLVRALCTQVESHARSGELVPVRALGLVDGAGQVTLLPEAANDRLRLAERTLRSKGLRPIDTPRLQLDLRSREVVLEPELQLDEGAVRDLLAQLPEGRRQEPWPGHGRYRIHRWLSFDNVLHVSETPTSARAVLRAWSALDRPHGPLAEQHLAQIVALLDEVPLEIVPNPGRRLADLFPAADD